MLCDTTRPPGHLQKTHKRNEYLQCLMETKSCTFQKSDQFSEILNHVFKTSKKTLSYSRTYCKIYKIENIGKIGQSAVVVMAKRVIYYGSTRSTLTPLGSQNGPLIFLDETSIPEKIEIITF